MSLSLGMSHYLLEDLEKGAAERDVWAYLLGWLTWTWISQKKINGWRDLINELIKLG